MVIFVDSNLNLKIMFKLILSIVLLVSVNLGIVGQEFQGMAVYESKTSTSDFKVRMEGNKSLTPEMIKGIEERMKKAYEKTFILHFDKSASIYKEEEKLDALEQGGGNSPWRMMAAVTGGGGGTYYKNVKDKTYTVDKELMGKEFLVKDTLTNMKWKMEAETRVIGGYNCYKATAIMPISKTDFRNFRPRDDKKPNGEVAQDKKPEGGEKKSSILDMVEVPKDQTITAWYTPEIPVNQGPEGYWGLPGLILEVNDGKTVILCSKIVLNPKEKVVIKPALKGKVISQKLFDETMIQKMEEMREMYRGRGGSGGPTMRIGN
jgi:GLPGLI family protein